MPTNGNVCWLCRRSQSEIEEFFNQTTLAEKEIQTKIIALEAEKRSFLKEYDNRFSSWPQKYREFEMRFILENKGQFTSLDWLAEFEEKALPVLEKLIRAWHDILDRGSVSFGGVSFGQGPKYEEGKESEPKYDDDKTRFLVGRRLEEFQTSITSRFMTDRTSARDEHPVEPLSLLKDRGLKDGLKFVRDAWVFYYELQVEAFKDKLKDLKNKHPTNLFNTHKVKDFPPVSVCEVCEEVMEGHRRIVMNYPHY